MMGMQPTYAQLNEVRFSARGAFHETSIVTPSSKPTTAARPITNLVQNHRSGDIGRDLQKAPRPEPRSAEYRPDPTTTGHNMPTMTMESGSALSKDGPDEKSDRTPSRAIAIAMRTARRKPHAASGIAWRSSSQIIASNRPGRRIGMRERTGGKAMRKRLGFARVEDPRSAP